MNATNRKKLVEEMVRAMIEERIQEMRDGEWDDAIFESEVFDEAGIDSISERERARILSEIEKKLRSIL